MKFFDKNNLLLFAISFLIPTWSIPHTIAIRYTAAVAALMLGITAVRNIRVNKAVYLPLVFLLIYFILISILSDTPFETLRNLWDDWGKSLLFFLVGACLCVKTTHSKRASVNFFLAFLFSVPCLVHICLVVVKFWDTGAIPWGWSGLSESHGDLGYTGLFAAPLLCATLLINLQTKRRLVIIAAGFLLCANFISILIAQSRGGTLFYVFSILVFLACFAKKRSADSSKAGSALLLASLVALSTIGLMWGSNAKTEGRLPATEKLILGFTLVEMVDAFQVSCHGQSALDKSGFFLSSDSSTKQKLSKAIDDGDVWRIFGLKTGLLLVHENPMGFYGAKNAYETLMINKCGAQPHVPLANTHNGWINTALTIGAPGALLFFVFLVMSLLLGLKEQRSVGDTSLVSTILCTTCLVWITRSFLDAAQQDQMLEMQFFVLGYLVSNARAFTNLSPSIPERDS